MKRFIILLFIFTTCILSVQAQKRYIVAFDCTKSMDHPSGDYSINGRDPSKLWIPAKNCIKSLWKQASHNDEFVILLYQNKILYTIKGLRGIQLHDWNSIESKMEDAIKNGGNTCIFQAWQTSEQYFTDNCDFYFITDGVEDHDNNNQVNDDEQAHIEAICNKIDEFCNLGINGFYTNLKQSENDNINNQISEKIKSSCFKDLIAGNITPLSLSLNQEDLNIGKKTFNLTFKPIDNQRVANVQKLEAVFVGLDGGLQNAGKYFKSTISGISNNKIKLTLEQITPVPQDLLNQTNSCKLFLNVLSNDKDVAIFPELITIDVRFYYEKIAYLPSIGLEGSSKYHPAFFVSSLADFFSDCDFIAEHKPDTISFDFKKMLGNNKLFNEEAIKHRSSYKLQLIPIREKDNDAHFILLKNGQICSNNTIDVTSSDENILMCIIFDESSVDGTFKFNLVPIEPRELDKINECTNIEEASILVTIEFDKDFNPLELWLCILGFIFLIITAIMFCWNNIIARKIMDKQICLIPDIYKPIAEVNNCVKCILTKKHPSGRNGFIHRIYFGPIQYVYLPEAVSDIILKTNYDDDIIVEKNILYDVNNMPLSSNLIIPQGVNNKFEYREQNVNFIIIIN